MAEQPNRQQQPFQLPYLNQKPPSQSSVPPHSRPVPPHPSRPVTSQSRPVNPSSRPVPPLSRPVPHHSRPVNPPSRPVPPLSRLVLSQSRPINPPSRPIPPPSRPVNPPSRLVPPQSGPVNPTSRSVPPPSRPVNPPSRPVQPQSGPVNPASRPIPPPSRPVNLPFRPVPPQRGPVNPPSRPVPPHNGPVNPPSQPVPPQSRPLPRVTTSLSQPSAQPQPPSSSPSPSPSPRRAPQPQPSSTSVPSDLQSTAPQRGPRSPTPSFSPSSSRRGSHTPPQRPSPTCTTTVNQSPSRAATKLQPSNGKGSLFSQSSQVESEEQPLIQVKPSVPSLDPSSSQPESPTKNSSISKQPKAKESEPTAETAALPDVRQTETQTQTSSQAQPDSRPTEAVSKASHDPESISVPDEFPIKNVPAKSVPETPIQPTKSDSKPDEIIEDPKGDSKSKLRTKPSPLSMLTHKTQENPKEKPEKKTEAKQEMHPIGTQRLETISVGTKKDCPETGTAAQEEMNPNENPRSEEASEEIKEGKPEIEIQTPNEKLHSGVSKEIRRVGPKSKPQPNNGQWTSIIRDTETEHTERQKTTDRKELPQTDFDGNTSRITISTIPRGSFSNGEGSNFQKEIKESLSKLVQKLSIGQQTGSSEQAVSNITLAGENKGASMVIGHQAINEKVSNQNHGGDKLEKRKGKVTSKNITIHEERSTEYDGSKNTISVNNNVQSINNSILHESSCNERNLGVHSILSSKPTEAIYFKGKTESLRTQKKASAIIPAQKPTYESNIKRRCLRRLLMESSDSDPENIQKPRRHGCPVSCDEKREKLTT